MRNTLISAGLLAFFASGQSRRLLQGGGRLWWTGDDGRNENEQDRETVSGPIRPRGANEHKWD